MIDRLSPMARNVALIAVFVLVGWFLWSVRSVLNPLILAYLLAFVVHPLVLRLEERGWRRRRAVNFIFGAFAVLLTLVALGVFFQSRGLAREFASENGLGMKVEKRLEQAVEEYKGEIAWVLQFVPQSKLPKPADGAQPVAPSQPNSSSPPDAPDTSGTQPHEVTADDLKQMVRDWWFSWLSEDRGQKAADVGMKVGGFFVEQIVGNVITFGLLLILLPIYTYFLLFELERIHRFIVRYLPRRDRERLVRIGGQIGEVLANFFRGRLLVCLAKGTILAVGLWIAGVDFALLLGLGTGFLSLIPFVGSAIGLVVALAVAMIDHSLVGALIRVGTVFLAAEMIENYFLIPKILGQSLGLHPIVVIFSLMAGAASMGMFGLLIALPLTATLVILAREFLLPVLAKIADEDRMPKPGGT